MQNTLSDYRFDPIDLVELRRWASLSPAQRIETMLHARELAVGLIRGQLSKRYPELAWPELNMKVLQEIERRGNQRIPNFNLFFAILHTLEAIQALVMASN